VPKALLIDDDTPRRRASSRANESAAVRDKSLLVRALLRNPKDVVAGAVAAIAAVAIVANAAFLQAGRHPAPMFSAVFPATTESPPAAVSGLSPLPRPRPSDADVHAEPKAAEAPLQAARAVAPPAASQSSAAPRPPAPIQAHADPVGDLIVSTRRISTVQRVLTEFGYGQLKPTGIAGPETKAAIERFERERKLPITGQISDRLTRELAAATGRPID
jgi:hypothetical protein